MKIASTIKLPIKIENGKFASYLPTIKQILESYNGHTIDVTFQKRKNKRSNNQNKYYWSVIVPIVQNCIREEWGELHTLEQVHEFLKHNCLFGEVVNKETGEVLRVVKSTTENSTTEQEDYHEKCRRLALDFFNTEIPLPNSEIELKFE